MTPAEATRAHVPEASAAASSTFDAVYEEEFPFVWRCLRALGVEHTALDDAAQDVFVVVHRKLHEFRGDSTLRTWLYGIVRNVASNHRRSAGRRGAPEPIDPHLPSPDGTPLERAEDAEAAAFVRRFVARLSDKNRDVFVLALLEGLSVPEVATALGIPLNTAYTRLRTVRQELKVALAKVEVRR